MSTARLPALLLSLLTAAPAAAQVTVYDNFGPGNGGWDYNWGLGWTVAGVDVPAQFGVEQAMGFDSSVGGVLTDVWVALWHVPLDPQADVVRIRLASNPSGQPPAPEDVLEEWVVTGLDPWDAWHPPHHLVGAGTTRLEAGRSYWLWAVGESTTWAGWCMNESPSLTCAHTLRREGQGWLPIAQETASAFRVDVLPDPGVASCFGVGCPCGNDDPTAGCANSTGSGALLAGAGSTSVAADDLVLTATGLPTEQQGLFYMGDAQVQGPFFDGFQCALGNTFRFLDSIQSSGLDGTMSYTGFVAGSGLVTPGSTWHFHVWHRDFPLSPCGTGANLTNLYSVTFTP